MDKYAEDTKTSTSASPWTASDDDGEFSAEQEALDRRIAYQERVINNNDFLNLEKK